MFIKAIIVVLLMAIASAGLLASIVVLIVGLVRRRRPVWHGALVAIAASLVLLAGSTAWGALHAFRKAHAVYVDVQAVSAAEDAARQGSPERMREWFLDITHLTLPAGAVYLNGRQVEEFLFNNSFLVFQIPPGFKATLDANFQSVPWSQVQTGLTPWGAHFDWRGQLPFWDVAKLEGKTYYKKIMRDDQGHVAFAVFMCLDSDTNVVHFAALEIRE